jgi:hypothetical protein
MQKTSSSFAVSGEFFASTALLQAFARFANGQFKKF